MKNRKREICTSVSVREGWATSSSTRPPSISASGSRYCGSTYCDASGLPHRKGANLSGKAGPNHRRLPRSRVSRTRAGIWFFSSTASTRPLSGGLMEADDILDLGDEVRIAREHCDLTPDGLPFGVALMPTVSAFKFSRPSFRTANNLIPGER